MVFLAVGSEILAQAPETWKLTETLRIGGAETGPEAFLYPKAIEADAKGRIFVYDWIWVEVYVEAEKRTDLPPRPAQRGPQITWVERTTFDVFDPRGRYIGRVTLPRDSQLMAVRDDRLLLLRNGSNDESLLSVMRLELQSNRAP